MVVKRKTSHRQRKKMKMKNEEDFRMVKMSRGEKVEEETFLLWSLCPPVNS